jgi:hypothetical protein
LYLDVDVITDPDLDKAAKATVCRHAEDPTEVKEVSPPIGNTLKTKLQVWQINPVGTHK